MADYQPLIARAVAGLEKNTGENRRALYERARTALVAQLRGVVPALDESEITRERLALEEAIRKIEQESVRQAREATRPQPTPPPKRPQPPPRRAEPPRPAPAPHVLSAGHDRTADRGESEGQRAPSWTDQPTLRDPSWDEPPAQRERAPDTRSTTSLTSEGLKGFRDRITEPPIPDAGPIDSRRPERPRYSAPPPPPPPSFDQLEPRLQQEGGWSDSPPPPPPQISFEEPRQRAPRPRPPRQDTLDDARAAPRPRLVRSNRQSLKMAVILLLLVAIGGLAIWQRGAISGVASSIMALVRTPSAPAPREAAPARPKITDRIGQPNAPLPAPGPAPAAGPPVAQRVVLYEEDPNDAQGRRFVGTVVWRTEMMPAAPGRAPELAVRGDIEVPERKMIVNWSLRRNTDQSLPASHTIEIMFNLPPDAPSGGVQNVPGVLMKQSEQTRGVPLAGLAVKVTPGFFLIGLSALESDMQRNIQLLKERSWFDIPIVYGNNRRAILAMEKGTPGEKAFADAFTAWRQ